jgi:putative ABC transport system permease protein
MAPKFLPLLLHNLMRNRRRTILTVFSIAVSVFIFAALMSLPAVVNQIMRDRANSLRVISYPKAGFSFQLPYSYARRIRSIPHVEAVAGETVFMGTYRDPKDLIPSVALDPEQVEEIWPDWEITRQAADQFRAVKSGALVGVTLMRRFRWHVGQNVILHGTVFPIDVQVTIVGTISGTAPSVALLFRRDHLDELLGRPGTVNLFWAKVDSSQSIPQVMAEIDERFANSAAETRTESELGISMSRMGGLKVLLDGARIFAVIVMFVIALVAANTAAMAVRERRHELAIMRSLGYTRARLIGLIATEGLLIGVTGGLAGCAIAMGALRLLPYASRSLGMFAFIIQLSPGVVAESFIAAALIGLGSSLVPASNATRGDIAPSLRALV